MSINSGDTRSGRALSSGWVTRCSGSIDLHHITPGNKRGHVQCKLRDIRTGRLVDHKFRSEDDVERAILDEHEMQFLYRDGDFFHFMNTATYEQIHLSQEVLGDQALYLLPESKISVEFYETEPVGIHLPLTVDLKVTDTVPGIKGATAAAQVKPATMRNGPGRDGAGVRERRRHHPHQHRNRRVPVARLTAARRLRNFRRPRRVLATNGPAPYVAKPGWIEVIAGSMFSGKSEELIRRLRRAQIAKQRVQIFKPGIDNRYSDDEIVSHSEMKIPSDNVQGLRRSAGARAVPTRKSSASTKASSSTLELPAACIRLANDGKRVIVAGLDQDYLGKPFEPMPQLLAIAEYITKTLAICMVCGGPANHTQRLVASKERVLVGATGTYEARCRHCWDPTLGSNS